MQFLGLNYYPPKNSFAMVFFTLKNAKNESQTAVNSTIPTFRKQKLSTIVDFNLGAFLRMAMQYIYFVIGKKGYEAKYTGN